ncbi:hypothetical protein GQ53DRAFT_438481 [Thozetella sp. PMI_491]|nr:hypothetical protein GQ53DRAFT_438481 [Thozetella sp. PMI_491]
MVVMSYSSIPYLTLAEGRRHDGSLTGALPFSIGVIGPMPQGGPSFRVPDLGGWATESPGRQSTITSSLELLGRSISSPRPPASRDASALVMLAPCLTLTVPVGRNSPQPNLVPPLSLRFLSWFLSPGGILQRPAALPSRFAFAPSGDYNGCKPRKAAGKRPHTLRVATSPQGCNDHRESRPGTEGTRACPAYYADGR